MKKISVVHSEELCPRCRLLFLEKTIYSSGSPSYICINKKNCRYEAIDHQQLKNDKRNSKARYGDKCLFCKKGIITARTIKSPKNFYLICDNRSCGHRPLIADDARRKKKVTNFLSVSGRSREDLIKARKSRQEHRKNSDVAIISVSTNPERTVCPKCKNGKLILKYNHYTHEEFISCSTFPKCSYSRDVKKN